MFFDKTNFNTKTAGGNNVDNTELIPLNPPAARGFKRRGANIITDSVNLKIINNKSFMPSSKHIDEMLNKMSSGFHKFDHISLLAFMNCVSNLNHKLVIKSDLGEEILHLSDALVDAIYDEVYHLAGFRRFARRSTVGGIIFKIIALQQNEHSKGRI